MRIVVVGAGVIGRAYGERLARTGDEVALLVRGPRLADLQANGLILEDADSGVPTEPPVSFLSTPSAGDHYDLLLIAVRCEQLASTLPILADVAERSNLLFFGNTTERQDELGHLRC